MVVYPPRRCTTRPLHPTLHLWVDHNQGIQLAALELVLFFLLGLPDFNNYSAIIRVTQSLLELQRCRSKAQNQTMAPESRPPNASEREDKQQLVNFLATGLLAGGEKEMTNQVNNELDPRMAVDTLNNDDKKLGMQDSEQQTRGKRSSFPDSLNTRHTIRFFFFPTGLRSYVGETRPLLVEPLADLPC